MWYCVRVFKTGGTDTLEISAGTSAANAISGTVIYRSTDYNFASGQIGFAIDQQLPATVDDLEIRLDRNADGDFSDPDEVVHSFDPFFIDASGYGSETLEYDRAGNLTYDGLYQ